MDKLKETLHSNLVRIKENDYELKSGEMATSYIEHMLHFIGDPDPVLRDELIYPTFCQWIAEKEYLNNYEMKELLQTLLTDDHLFHRLGNDGDDSVFKRSFSILVIDVLLWKNQQNPFIPMDQFHQIKDKLIGYYKNEKDLRGYVHGKGWAHAAAHGADAMCELVRSQESDEDVMREILDAVNHVLNNGKYMLCHEEDERMALIVLNMIVKRPVPDQTISKWIAELPNLIGSEKDHGAYITRVNLKNFTRSLIFSLRHQSISNDGLDMLYKTEATLNTFLPIQKQIGSQ